MGLGGLPSTHPNFISMPGMHGSYAANMAMYNTDLLIALGVRFDDRVTGRLDFVCAARPCDPCRHRSRRDRQEPRRRHSDRGRFEARPRKAEQGCCRIEAGIGSEEIRGAQGMVEAGPHPAMVYSSIDQMGRYAYGNQPGIMQWNLAQFAQAIDFPLGGAPEKGLKSAQAAIDAYPDIFKIEYLAVLRQKIGLAESHEGDGQLAQDLLKRMAENWRRLFADVSPALRVQNRTLGCGRTSARIVSEPGGVRRLGAARRLRLAQEVHTCTRRTAAMKAINPALHTRRNHRVEEVIASAQSVGNFAPLDELLLVLAQPYADQPENRTLYSAA